MASKVSPKFSRVTVQRTLEHLRRGTVVISNKVDSMSMNTHIDGDKNLGARHFLFENIPQLKYKSPHVKFDLAKQTNSDAILTITYKDGNKMVVNCSGKSSTSILEEVKNLCNGRQASDHAQSNNLLEQSWL